MTKMRFIWVLVVLVGVTMVGDPPPARVPPPGPADATGYGGNETAQVCLLDHRADRCRQRKPRTCVVDGDRCRRARPKVCLVADCESICPDQRQKGHLPCLLRGDGGLRSRQERDPLGAKPES